MPCSTALSRRLHALRRPRVGLFSTTMLTLVSVAIAVTAVAAPAATVSCVPPVPAPPPQLRVTGYEPATIAGTNYPAPGGALFVSNAGKDTNPGTVRAPLATIGKALTLARSGGTIVVRGGVYRESPGVLKQRVTIQPYPHETAWVKGSVVLSAFTRHGSVWTASWSSPLCDSCYPAGTLDRLHPAAGLPEQVFNNGAPVAQVTASSAVKPNTFYVDHKARQLVLGDNPTHRTIEVTRFATALSIAPTASGTTIRGIGFAHWGTTYDGDAAIVVHADGVRLDHDTFAWSAARALGVYGTHDTITSSAIVDNGMTGMSAHAATSLDFDHNDVAFSNFEHWNITPSLHAQVAGAKNTNSVGAVFRANRFHDNDGNGLWFDAQSNGQIVVGNTIVRNSGHGLVVEISSSSIVAGNVVADNGRDGLKLSGASDVAVYNNTVVNNGWAQARVDADPRHKTGPVTLANDIFIAGARSINYVLYSYDMTVPGHITTLQILAADDHNVYGRTSVKRPASLVFAQTSARVCSTYANLTTFRSAAHRELASTSVDGLPLTRTFVDPVHENYKLARGAILPTPTLLPASVAAALGIGRNVGHVGA